NSDISAALSENNECVDDVESGGILSGSEPLLTRRARRRKSKSQDMTTTNLLPLKSPSQSHAPYCCKACGKYFNVKTNLIQHEKTHINVSSTSTLRKHSDKRYLKSHQQIQTWEKPCSCHLLQLFVSERLRAVATEIFGAVEKTITEYQEEISRSKEDNDRLRALFDIAFHPQLPKAVLQLRLKTVKVTMGWTVEDYHQGYNHYNQTAPKPLLKIIRRFHAVQNHAAKD
ncbi:unnamed protein product, partial [Coregonus sp. 'balchen']